MAACLAPAPDPAGQLAIARFMREGHYMRHLRRTKRIYAKRAEALRLKLMALGIPSRLAGLAILIDLPHTAADRAIADQAYSVGLAPSPLSLWGCPQGPGMRKGLLLGVSNAREDQIDAACVQLRQIIQQHAAI